MKNICLYFADFLLKIKKVCVYSFFLNGKLNSFFFMYYNTKLVLS